MQVNAQRAEIKGVFILRDKDGKPKFDDPHNVPPLVLAALNEDDLKHLEKLRQNDGSITRS